MTKEEALALIQRMAEDIDPQAFECLRKYSDPKSPPHQFWLVLCDRATKIATKLIESGWRPTIDKPDKT